MFFITTQIQAQTWDAQKLELGALQNTTVAEEGDFYVYLNYRFGSLEEDETTFLNSDNHNINLKLVYGLWEGLQLGLSWEAWQNTYSGSAKMILMQQSEGYSMDVTAYGAIHLNGDLSKDNYPFMKEADRLSYTSQILIGKHFSEKIFVEVAPTFVRQNLVWEKIQKHNQFAIGIGGQFRLAEQAAIYVDYVAHFNRNETTIFKDPLTFGLDFYLGKFILGISASNAQAFNDASFISNGEGDWGNGGGYLGLNVIKVF